MSASGPSGPLVSNDKSARSVGSPDKCVLENYFLYFSSKTHVVGTQKNHLNETVLLSTGTQKNRLNETVLLSTQNTCLN